MNKIKSSWDLESITSKKQLDKIDAELKKISSAAKKFREKWLKRTDYLTSPKVLATALAEYNKWAQDFNTAGSIGYRLWLESSINMTNTKVKADLNKVHQISVDNANKIQFFTLNISKINKGIQKKLLQSSLLLPYKHFLESLFTQGQYTLTDTEEQILNIKSKTSNYNWENMLQTLLSTEVAKVKGK